MTRSGNLPVPWWLTPVCVPTSSRLTVRPSCSSSRTTSLKYSASNWALPWRFTMPSSCSSLQKTTEKGPLADPGGIDREWIFSCEHYNTPDRWTGTLIYFKENLVKMFWGYKNPATVWNMGQLHFQEEDITIFCNWIWFWYIDLILRSRRNLQF